MGEMPLVPLAMGGVQPPACRTCSRPMQDQIPGKNIAEPSMQENCSAHFVTFRAASLRASFIDTPRQLLWAHGACACQQQEEATDNVR